MARRMRSRTTFLPTHGGERVEALGIVAFRASPVWVLAALAECAEQAGS